ncbi:unnamed protein product [Phytomonas sp. Hart1]|nr:unnamed protein product [Phytomonas sp. Hart1]|eukprot:CCW70568.1 unnamed protein product [Phytomonas sp. isolate Hart1]
MVKKHASGENIRVVIRVRDLLPYEAERGDKALVRLDLATNQVIVQHLIGDPDIFAFDSVFNNTFTQRDLFLQEVQPLVDAVLQGYNATVFAYGQSGSGKTYTMTGNIEKKELWGIMPQVVEYLFTEIKKVTSSTKTFKVKVSYVEIYNGKTHDLLSSKLIDLEIKQTMAKNFYVKGAEMPEIANQTEALRLFNKGTERRRTASTDLNDTSSRSHSLFTVQIEQFNFENDPSSPIVMSSKINLVDLAGSEKLSKTNATGDTIKEGCNINLSLSALATVIDTIVKGGKHIPYRGSPLTMLLKDSLGGTSKTVMFANTGPSDKNTSETISTLRFATRAKQIENKPIKNLDPKDSRIQDLLDQIEELKSRLGNVDLNIEDSLRQRIEELEIENSDLRVDGEKGALEIEEQCRMLKIKIEEKDKELLERQRDLHRLIDERGMNEANLANETHHLNELRRLNANFIKRICSDEELNQIKLQMPNDGSYNMTDDNWDVKEIAFYLHGFAELYEHWRKVTYTKDDMEKYAARAMAEMQEHLQLQINDAIRSRDELLRQRDEEAAQRTADSVQMSQLKVELNSLRDENTKLREKIERDQEKIKTKLAKSKDEYKALQDQLETTKATVTEKERDIERLKRMLSDAGVMANLNTGSSFLSTSNWGNMDERSAVLRQLEEVRESKDALERKIKETNVSLRRFGICIADDPPSDDALNAANKSDAFMLAAIDEEPINDDVFAQLQQQLRSKQRLLELAHQQQTQLGGMIRKFELLTTGKVTSDFPEAHGHVNNTSGVAAAIDEATIQQLTDLLQSKEDTIESLRLEKDQISDKLVHKLNKNEQKIRDLESAIEEERTQINEESSEMCKEREEYQTHIQQLSLDLETSREQLKGFKQQLESMQRANENKIDYMKGQIQELQRRLDETRNKSAEFEEMEKSYERLQRQMARTEQALNEKTEHLENNRQVVKWSNSLLEREKRKSEELEMTIRQLELEMRKLDETWRTELAEQVNKQIIANNRRFETQAEQFQQIVAGEHEKQRSLQKKIKSAKSTASKAEQRYDELILENESIISQLEELKVASLKMYLEKQEAQRDLDALCPTNNIRARAF